MDVSLRSLRYFVAVAEESHISRAALRLHIAQPALSRTVARLERELGLALFVRTSTGVELTEAGRSLVPTAREALGAVDAWHASACAADDARRRTLSIAYHSSIPDDLLRAIIDRFGTSLPDWQLEWRLGDWTDPTRPVREGRVAAALLQLPVGSTDGLRVHVLRRDRRVVALPVGHRLEARPTVTLSDLEDEPFVALPTAIGPLRDFCLATDQRQTPPQIAREVDNAEDFFQAVITGQGIAMMTESSGRAYRRPGITYRLVDDVPDSALGVLWPAANRTPASLDAFLRACSPEIVEAGSVPRRSR